MADAHSGTAHPAADHRAFAVALIDISADVRRKSLQGTGMRPLPNGSLDILRVVESSPGITVAEVATRLGRQLSNVSTQLRELVAGGLITRERDAADKRYVSLHPTPESVRIRLILEKAWSDVLESAMSQLSSEERANLDAAQPAFERLAAILGKQA